MPIVHLRVVCPAPLAVRVVEALANQPGAVAVRSTPVGDTAPDETVVEGDLPRERVDAALGLLRQHGIDGHSLIALEPIATAIGGRARYAEKEAPGAGDDAVIWDELTARTGSDATLTGTYLAFMILATLLGAIGVVTDSPITLVGAMVVGPEFGALAGVAVGIVRRTPHLVRRSVLALLVGFALGIVAATLAALLARATGLITAADLTNQQNVEFIYHPGWFSIITAVIAGTAGMLSLASSRTAVLVGVFISVTTIPAAGNAAVAFALGQWHELGQSLLQLAINLSGIVAAGTLTLLVRRRI